MSRERAEWCLGPATHNAFLVRESSRGLVLSTKIGGWIAHYSICCGTDRYYLRGRRENFASVSKLLQYYHRFPIKKGQVLQLAYRKEAPGKGWLGYYWCPNVCGNFQSGFQSIDTVN